MRHKEKNKKSDAGSNALFILESAKNALEVHKNFNLAEVWIGEYFLMEKKKDKAIQRGVIDALKNRDSYLLLAAIEAEIERLRIEKVKKLRKHIVKHHSS